MKKTLLTLAAMALTTVAATAQVGTDYKGKAYSRISNDGIWAVEDNYGVISLLNRQTGAETDYQDESGEIYCGLGHYLAEDGTAVGSSNMNAIILKDGKITTPEQPTGIGSSMNTANSITPDGKRICGGLGTGESFGGDGMMSYPVVWTLNGEGEYKCTPLPYPTKDFLGLAPQYVTAVDMSADGKTIMGQVTSNSGMYCYPILYTEDAEGNWSYQLVCADLVYDAEKIAALPAAPVEPAYPNVEDYMDDADKAAYQAAMEKYNEDVANYWAGLITEYPAYPNQADYIADAERKAQYDAAESAYKEASDKYWTEKEAWDALLEEAVTGSTFTLNGLALAQNGQYAAATIECLDPDGEIDPWFPWITPTISSVCRFDIKAEGVTSSISTDSDNLVSAVTNAGAVISCSPVKVENARNSYVLYPGQTVSVGIEKMVESNAEASKFLKDNYLFNVTLTSYDEEKEEEVTTTVTDSLITGSVTCNADGTILVSWMYDVFTNPDEFTPRSYVIDLSTKEGIGEIMKGEEAEGTVTAREFYNLQGQRIAAPAANGIYLEKVSTTKGVKTYKRMK